MLNMPLGEESQVGRSSRSKVEGFGGGFYGIKDVLGEDKG